MCVCKYAYIMYYMCVLYILYMCINILYKNITCVYEYINMYIVHYLILLYTNIFRDHFWEVGLGGLNEFTVYPSVPSINLHFLRGKHIFIIYSHLNK